VQIEYDKVVDE